MSQSMYLPMAMNRGTAHLRCHLPWQGRGLCHGGLKKRCERSWQKKSMPFWKRTPLKGAYNRTHPELNILTPAHFEDTVTFFRAIGQSRFDRVRTEEDGVLQECHPLFM